MVEVNGIREAFRKARGWGWQEPMNESNQGQTRGITQKRNEDPLRAINHSSSKQMVNWNCNAMLICFI